MVQSKMVGRCMGLHNQQHCEVLTGQGLHHRELDSEECAHEVLEWWAKV